MIAPGYLEMQFHARTDAESSAIARRAAAECPRCPACRHHPNAHRAGNCSVIVERHGNRQAKCGCTAARSET